MVLTFLLEREIQNIYVCYRNKSYCNKLLQEGIKNSIFDNYDNYLHVCFKKLFCSEMKNLKQN